MRIGVMCPSEIAIRRFMPAVKMMEEIEFIGVGLSSKEEREEIDSEALVDYSIFHSEQMDKAKNIINNYGGRIFDAYENVVESDDIDAVYIPLPPALHYKWAKRALENGKHILIEKPSTLYASDTEDLIRLAQKKGLSMHENYMFMFHSQLDRIDDIINSGEIGDVRLYRISFGFPRRAHNDFRYSKQAGGGALLDAGGYTIKYAVRLLGSEAKLVQAQVSYVDKFEVEMYGSGVMVNNEGVTAQLAFGMDNDYKCELEVWGSQGTLYTNRVFTAPVDYKPILRISKNGIVSEIELSSDNTFRKSICRFMECVSDENMRKKNAMAILKQAKYVDDFRNLSKIR